MAKKRAMKEVGMTGTVTCKRVFSNSDISSVMIQNEVGGSSFLPPGRYRVRVVHGFDDYETGRRLHGLLLDVKDVATARKVGTAKYPSTSEIPKFEPEKVYFSADDFKPES